MSPLDASPDTADPESDLVGRLLARDERAFEELIRSQGGRLLAAARRILGNEEDAQDAVQEGFLAAFRGIDAFDGRAQLSTWLFRIVTNQALMKLRRRKPGSRVSVEDLLPSFTEYGHHKRSIRAWRPEASVEAEDTRQMVRRHIDLLPDTYRAALVLRDIEERPLPEVADLLGITVNAVKIRVHRARQALRAMLADRLQEVGT